MEESVEEAVNAYAVDTGNIEPATVLRILTDRGAEYCGKVEQHDYPLYLAINDIEHAPTKARHPQTNGICERFHKTIWAQKNLTQI